MWETREGEMIPHLQNCGGQKIKSSLGCLKLVTTVNKFILLLIWYLEWLNIQHFLLISPQVVSGYIDYQ